MAAPVHLTLLDADEAECLVASDTESRTGPSGHVLLQVAKRTADKQLVAPDADKQLAAVGTVGTDLPAFMVEQMILPDPYKCVFYENTGKVCDEAGLAAVGLELGNITEAGRTKHEFINTLRVQLPLGTVPCCPTAPFCSSPKCSQSFLEQSKAAPQPVCVKRSADENFGNMTDQEQWPAYFAYCGGYPFDVHKHWNVLNRVLGCPSNSGQECDSAETFDLVIDLGCNFGMVTEELTTRHFAKSYIMVDVAPFAGPNFAKRLGNKTWKDVWFQEQVPHREKAVVPEYEFHQYGLSDREGGTIDPCIAWGYNGSVPCPVEMANVDSFIPGKLSEDFQRRFEAAASAFIKIDVEGWDQLAVQGMAQLLGETRGAYTGAEGSAAPDTPRHLVNFIMLEYAPQLMKLTRADNQSLIPPSAEYNLKTMTATLEAHGFEVFLTGPRYLPLTHGSWDDRFNNWFESLSEGAQHCPQGSLYPKFKDVACPSGICECTFATDLFAMRASHPKAAEIKLALGACAESEDFHEDDPQYDMSPMSWEH